MPAICERRILAVGGSRAVALPPDWLTAFDLNSGDVVQVIYDSVVIVKPSELSVDPDFFSKELASIRKKLTCSKITGSIRRYSR